MNKIDDQIRNYYQKQKLDEHRADAILDSGRQFSHVRCLRSISIFALAAAATIVIAVYFDFPGDRRSVNEIISAEVASSHLKQLDPELRIVDYQELQAAFDKLDFSIIPTQEFILNNFNLMGGRYCTLCGETTAQLKLVNKITGEPCLLYIAKLDALIADIRPDTVVVDGVHIQMWKSNGLFFAMSRMDVATL